MKQKVAEQLLTVIISGLQFIPATSHILLAARLPTSAAHRNDETPSGNQVDMELALGVVSVTAIAVRCGSKLWSLSDAWRDAPADIHHLRDDMASTEHFFGEIRQHIQATELRPPYERLEMMKDTAVQQPELKRLMDDGVAVLRQIEAIVDGLLACNNSSTRPVEKEVTIEVRKRIKLLWLRQVRKAVRLRKELAHVRASICRLLISQNM